MIIRRFISVILILILSSPIHAYELEGLMVSSNFTRDQVLSKDIAEILSVYTVSTQNDVFTNINRKPYYAAEVLKTGLLWKEYIQPECRRLKVTYEDAMEENLEDPVFVKTYNEFKNKFENRVFSICEEFEQKIRNYLDNDMQANHVIPRELKVYSDNLDRVRNSPTVLGVKSLADQSSNSYKIRNSLKDGLKIMIHWVDSFQPNHPQLKEWKKQFDNTNNGYEAIAKDYQDLFFDKSGLPLDLFADDNAENIQKGEQLRNKITELINNQFDQQAIKIIIRDSEISTARARWNVKDGKLQGEYFDAIAFVAVISIDESKVSTHKGWYEHIRGGNERIVFSEGEDDFSNSRSAQIVKSGKRKSESEKPSQRESAKPKYKSRDMEIKIDNEVAEAQSKAQAQVAAELMAINNIQKKGTTDSNSRFGILHILSVIKGLLMVIAGLLLINGFLSEKLPEKLLNPVYKFMHMISQYAAYLGLGLIALALLGLIINLISFSLSGLVYSFVAGAAGFLVATNRFISIEVIQDTESNVIKGNFNSKKSYYKNSMEMVQNHQTLIGMMSIVIGILILIGIS